MTIYADGSSEDVSRAVCEAFSDPEVAEVLVADRALEIGDVSAGEKLVPYASYSISSLKYQGLREVRSWVSLPDSRE